MEDKIKQLPTTVTKGDITAGLHITYKYQIKKWVFSYGRMTSKNIYYKDNISKIGLGDTLDEAYDDFINKMKSFKI